ncbi:MAG TPA: electron transport complex subunit E [Chromatiaceae bacterium]|jgi:electron transport complex protein RnfE|nr:electron transport complex subunit E [Chromatiaceae bacterium]HIB84018.1 electron transport complex subunit E [Chromatiaceae bacterium]HIN81992.1 electron transport complex subunit E [Chromatiales bacterium]HIO14117.1 electron transport complex subunit E [Chromatiales bacterium]HIO54266.1 electron transport complex subunit E [Chromatiales bacterium]
MSDNVYGDIVTNGLWTNNQALVALLGLCPLLAVSSTAINGLGLGVATMATLTLTNLIVASIRRWILQEIRIPMFVIIIACVVTAIELLMNAHLHDLYRVLGIFVPLIVTNCAIIGRAEAFASKNNVVRSTLDGLVMGLGFALVLVFLGIIREILGYGTIFRGAELMLGPWASDLTITLASNYDGLLLAILPPGAFMALAVIIALKNKIDRVQQRRSANAVSVAVPLQSSRA